MNVDKRIKEGRAYGGGHGLKPQGEGTMLRFILFVFAMLSFTFFFSKPFTPKITSNVPKSSSRWGDTLYSMTILTQRPQRNHQDIWDSTFSTILLKRNPLVCAMGPYLILPPSVRKKTPGYTISTPHIGTVGERASPCVSMPGLA